MDEIHYEIAGVMKRARIRINRHCPDDQSQSYSLARIEEDFCTVFRPMAAFKRSTFLRACGRTEEEI